MLRRIFVFVNAYVIYWLVLFVYGVTVPGTLLDSHNGRVTNNANF